MSENCSFHATSVVAPPKAIDGEYRYGTSIEGAISGADTGCSAARMGRVRRMRRRMRRDRGGMFDSEYGGRWDFVRVAGPVTWQPGNPATWQPYNSTPSIRKSSHSALRKSKGLSCRVAKLPD